MSAVADRFYREERRAKERARSQVLERDGYACRILGCDVTFGGGDDELEVESLSRGDVVDVDLMITVCHEHGEMIRERRLIRQRAA